jgi:hypothetical protein
MKMMRGNRLMMQELMIFRHQVFQHIREDWADVLARSMSLWSPRERRPVASPSSMLLDRTAAAGSAPSPVSEEKAAMTEEEEEEEEEGESEGLLVQDIALPDLWIPGRLIHIYGSRTGQYRACTVHLPSPLLSSPLLW